MDKIIKALLFNKKARVTLIDSLETVKTATKIHELSPLAAATLGRALTAGAYIGTNLKGDKSRFSLTIKGNGPIGNVVIAGESGNTVRGFVANPNIELPLKADGKLDVGGAVGRDGFINVIKDYGLKRPYNGSCELVDGEIAKDFATYLLKSEGIRSIVSLGVRLGAQGVISAGGIIVEALPNIEDDMITILEDVIYNIGQVSLLLEKKSIKEILEFHFGHLDCQLVAEEDLHYKCNCNEERMISIIKSLGKNQVFDIIEQEGKVEIECQFCNSKYVYGLEEAKKFWGM